MKKFLIILGVIVVGLGLYFIFGKDGQVENVPSPSTNFEPDPASATFTFNGEPITLSHGLNEMGDMETKLLPDKTTGDLNSDGKADSVVLLARLGGGSGVFIYIGAYVSGPVNYRGSNAIFVGDRISPQSLSVSDDVVTFHYLDRDLDEAFSAEPTISTSKQFVYKNGEFVEK